METYNPKNIEAKWQKKWADDRLYETNLLSDKEKIYVLDMFPYPSGEGLHVGHPKGYIATDIYSRMKKMSGFEVLHPMGWDAFGLPAEQFALKNKIHPALAVEKNITRFKEQLSIMGFNYDWSKEINTTDPGFYRWTQWIWKQMWKKGLAYESNEPINWCPSCKTGLANEDLDGDECERCGTKVEKKPLRQWVLKITDYADRMIADLDKLDWPQGVKLAQKNWIGKSDGSEIEFKLCVGDTEPGTYSVQVFTTRADTLMGATYIAVSAELAEKWMTMGWNPAPEIQSFVHTIFEEEKTRAYDLKEVAQKEGIYTEVDAIHPITGERIPVWIANYVLPGYGTGAIMAVPAHDERDHEFATKYGLPIKKVIEPFFIDDVSGDAPTVEREAIMAIVKHWSEDKYIGLKWKKVAWGTFITGGVEEGQTPEEAAMAEIRQETGFQNIKLIKTLPRYHSKFFHEPKAVNRFAHFHDFYFELENDERKELSEEENEIHEVVWLTPEELEKFITPRGHRYIWDILQGNDSLYVDDGILCASGKFDGLESKESRVKITEDAGGKLVSQYKLKDWVFARQRYWGEPFPIVFDENHMPHAVADSELPVKLPEVEAYEPTGTGESPLAAIADWVNVTGYLDENGDFVTCDASDSRATKFTRETNTMPQWAGSSWYYLRFADPHNERALIDKDIEKKWQPVDVYVGGDHATRHLIYARFWHKFLYDIGVVSYDEPFSRLEFLGFILAEDGRKMSKRLGNVVNPDDVVKEYGADTLRVYEMFMAPFEQTARWDTKSIVGVERFLERVWKLRSKVKAGLSDSDDVISILHKTIKKVGEDIESFKFNTAISAMMICLNQAEKEEGISEEWYGMFLSILAPFAPHMAEELWHEIGQKGSVHTATWPTYDESRLEESNVTIAIQMGGKLRGTLNVPRGTGEEAVLEEVKKLESYEKYVGAATPKKVIFVPNKLINIVI